MGRSHCGALDCIWNEFSRYAHLYQESSGEAMIKTLLVVLLFAGPVWAQDQVANALATAGCGPNKVELEVKKDKRQHPTGQVEPGKALVYVFGGETRDPDVSYFGGPTVRLGVDGTWMGATQYQSYFFFPVSAGGHRMCAGWQSSIAEIAKIRTAASFNAEAGEVYYFRIVSERRQKREPTIKIEPLDGAEGALLIASSALSTSKTKK
jgi:hypothetical protein